MAKVKSTIVPTDDPKQFRPTNDGFRVSADKWIEYITKPVRIKAIRADKAGVIKTLEGPAKYEAGDYIITGLKGEQYPVDEDTFEYKYRHVKDDIYEAKPVKVKVFKTDRVLKLKTKAGVLTASMGDYIIKGESGSLYPCKPDIFEAKYKPVVEASVKVEAPFKSKSQMRWMFKNDPKMAKKWAKHTKSIKNLPEKIDSRVLSNNTIKVYHGTGIRNLNSIIKHGLNPNKITHKYYVDHMSALTGVYVSTALDIVLDDYIKDNNSLIVIGYIDRNKLSVDEDNVTRDFYKLLKDKNLSEPEKLLISRAEKLYTDKDIRYRSIMEQVTNIPYIKDIYTSASYETFRITEPLLPKYITTMLVVDKKLGSFRLLKGNITSEESDMLKDFGLSISNEVEASAQNTISFTFDFASITIKDLFNYKPAVEKLNKVNVSNTGSFGFVGLDKLTEEQKHAYYVAFLEVLAFEVEQSLGMDDVYDLFNHTHRIFSKDGVYSIIWNVVFTTDSFYNKYWQGLIKKAVGVKADICIKECVALTILKDSMANYFDTYRIPYKGVSITGSDNYAMNLIKSI